MLRAVAFALPALDALGRAAGISAESGALQVLPPGGTLSFGIHGVVAAERAGDVHPLGTGHTVAAAGTANLYAPADFLLDPLHQGLTGFRHTPWSRVGGGFQVFPHHVQGVHAGQHAGDLWLVVEPAEGQFRRRTRLRVLSEQLLGGFRQQVHQASAPQGLHDDDRQALGVGIAQAVHPSLRGLVHVVVLDLAEIPVISVYQALEHLGVSVVGKEILKYNAFHDKIGVEN